MSWVAPPTFVSGTVCTAGNLNILSGDLALLASAVSLYVPGSPISGSLPASNSGTFLLQAGQNGFAFSGGLSPNFNFPTPFPNGLLTVQCMPAVIGGAADFVLTLTGNNATAFNLGCLQSGSPVTGTLDVTWFAIGF